MTGFKKLEQHKFEAVPNICSTTLQLFSFNSTIKIILRIMCSLRAAGSSITALRPVIKRAYTNSWKFPKPVAGSNHLLFGLDQISSGSLSSIVLINLFGVNTSPNFSFSSFLIPKLPVVVLIYSKGL